MACFSMRITVCFPKKSTSAPMKINASSVRHVRSLRNGIYGRQSSRNAKPIVISLVHRVNNKCVRQRVGGRSKSRAQSVTIPLSKKSKEAKSVIVVLVISRSRKKPVVRLTTGFLLCCAHMLKDSKSVNEGEFDLERF